MSRSKINLFLAGVGGQGILTAAQIMGKLAIENGLNVLVNEIHGMAQRGGNVTCNIRYGDVLSPLIPRGRADVIAAFEPVESLRNLHMANKDTFIIVNTSRIYPFTVSLGQERYPPMDEIKNTLSGLSERVIFLDANSLAREAGAEITTNIVLVGAISALEIFSFTKEQVLATVRRIIPPEYMDANMKAFEMGYRFVRER